MSAVFKHLSVDCIFLKVLWPRHQFVATFGMEMSRERNNDVYMYGKGIANGLRYVVSILTLVIEQAFGSMP